MAEEAKKDNSESKDNTLKSEDSKGESGLDAQEAKNSSEVKDKPGPSSDSSGKSLIEQHREEREKMEKAVAAMKIENDRREKMIGEAELGGKGFANLNKNEPKEKTAKDYSKDVLAGKYNEQK